MFVRQTDGRDRTVPFAGAHLSVHSSVTTTVPRHSDLERNSTTRFSDNTSEELPDHGHAGLRPAMLTTRTMFSICSELNRLRTMALFGNPSSQMPLGVCPTISPQVCALPRRVLAMPSTVSAAPP